MMKESQITADLNALVEQITIRPELRRSFIIALLFGAGLIDWLTEGTSGMIYAVPVAAGAALEGWRGAGVMVAASAMGTLAFAPRLIIGARGLELLGLALIACCVAAVTGRERRLRCHYQKVADQLSGIYEKVQANFEGMKRVERLSAIGQLSAGLAHEIRNPLASISGAAAILARGQSLDPKNAKCVEIIASECERLNGLLTNFLNFARPRAPRLRVIEIEPVLENVLELASHGVRGKSVHFEKKLEAGLHPVECDPEQLEQVLLNLMINAIEANPEGGTITLSAAAEEGRMAIAVVDQGHGVAPAHIDRLFDPFFTTKEHGTGLGLPVAHQIVRQMGGSLLARANDGHGMTFSVVLPFKVQKV